VGAYSSIFIASPLLVHLRSREPEIVKLAKSAARHDGKVAASAAKRAAREEANAIPASAGVAVGSGTPTAAEAQRSDAPARPAAPAVRPAAQRAADAADPRTPDDVRADGESGTLTGRKVHKWAQAGPRNQPKRPPKSKR
jgi:preprotein translocase subunit SecF